jgi:hypothetical protein
VIYYIADPFELLNSSRQPERVNYRLPSGGILTAEKLPRNQIKIESIFSTDPMDYMNARLAPGEIVTLKCEIAEG